VHLNLNALDKSLITGLRMSICGLICFAISQYYQLSEGYWAVVTISAITLADFSSTFVKAILRLTGTLVGAWLGFVAAESIGNSPYVLFAVILLFTTITTYIGLQTKPYNYLTVVAGFSAVIIIESRLLGNIEAVALYRTLEICLGIIIMAIVSSVMAKCLASDDKFFDANAPKKIVHLFQTIHFSTNDLLHALIISLTASLTFLSWMIFQYSQGVWCTITILVIMEDHLKATDEKALARFLGQVLAAIFGGAVAILFPTNLVMVGIALGFGFFICGMLIGSGHKLASMGNHAGSAMAIMLLAGLPNNALEVVEGRFINVVAGIVITTLVSYCFRARLD
jgi:uncharacterized membrane protein YccC